METSLDGIKIKVSEFYRSHAPLIKQLGADTLYGLLTLGALVPFAGATQQGDLAVINAISSLIGGVGVNLLSNILQRGKDNVDAKVAREVQALAESDPELRQKLDEILKELSAVNLAGHVLEEQDRPNFKTRLESAIKQVGSSIIYTESVTYVNGDITAGTFIGRDQITYNYGYSSEDVERLVSKIFDLLLAGANFARQDSGEISTELNGEQLTIKFEALQRMNISSSLLLPVTPLSQLKRKRLLSQRQSLIEEYEAATQQVIACIDESIRVRLSNQLNQLEQKIAKIDQDLLGLE